MAATVTGDIVALMLCTLLVKTSMSGLTNYSGRQCTSAATIRVNRTMHVSTNVEDVWIEEQKALLRYLQQWTYEVFAGQLGELFAEAFGISCLFRAQVDRGGSACRRLCLGTTKITKIK